MPRTGLLATALLLPVILVLVLLPAAALAAQKPSGTALTAQPCSDSEPAFPSCGISKDDEEKADDLYKQATKLVRREQFDKALDKIKAARTISPHDTVYATAEQAIREKVANSQMRLGDQALQKGDEAAAIAAFGRAAELDPGNQYATQRLHDATPEPDTPSPLAEMTSTMGEVRLEPEPGTHDFKFRGSAISAFQTFAALYGITTVVDSTLTTGATVRVAIENVDWQTGSEIMQRVCKILVLPVGPRQALLAADTEETRRDLTRMSLRTFYDQNGSSPQQLTDLTTALRILFDLRFVLPNLATQSITVRAPQATLDAVTRFLDDLQEDQPTVMLQIQVFEVSTDLTHDIGISIPDQFSVFNVTSEIEKLVTGSTYQQIVSALEAAGQSVNTGTILAALLASSTSSAGPLSQPFATFGGGLGLTGIGIAASDAHFQSTRSLARTLDQVLLRTEHGNAATMKVGERYPIVSTQYSASTPSSSLLSSLGLNAAAAATLSATTIPSPQFNYEDLGLVLKATPQVHGGIISIDYELTLRALGPTQSNGLPILTNRESKGSIGTTDGHPVVIAGLVSKSESISLTGIPVLSGIPVMGKAFSVANNERTTDELLIVVTPHMTSSRRAQHGLYEPVPMNVPK